MLEQRHWAIRWAASKAAMPEKTPALMSLALVLAVRTLSLGRPLPWLGLAAAGAMTALSVAVVVRVRE